jgi:hypothetical protein
MSAIVPPRRKALPGRPERPAVALLFALTSVAGCGSAEPTISPGELMGEYARATDVRNDRFPSTGGSSEDRLANFASMGTPDQLAGSMLRTYECGEGGGSSRGPSSPCELTGAVSRDFRSGNDLLDHDDTILTVRKITSVPGEGELVVVSGHTPSVWQWWLIGGSALLAVAGIGIVVVRHRRSARYWLPLISRRHTAGE